MNMFSVSASIAQFCFLNYQLFNDFFSQGLTKGQCTEWYLVSTLLAIHEKWHLSEIYDNWLRDDFILYLPKDALNHFFIYKND